MKKKLLSITLALCFIFAAFSVVVYAKTIIVRDIYRINGEEVSKEAYEAEVAKRTAANEDIEYVNVYHDIEVECPLGSDSYTINGKAATEAEVNKYISGNTISREITITASDLTGLNAGSLGDYLSFETVTSSGVTYVSAIKVKSSVVTAVKYDYSDDYLSFCNQKSGKYYFAINTAGITYQDQNTGHFKIGKPATTNYYVADEDGTASKAISSGEYIIYFEYNSLYVPISFENIFDSITITISE